jgi:hypothetical protein
VPKRYPSDKNGYEREKLHTLGMAVQAKGKDLLKGKGGNKGFQPPSKNIDVAATAEADTSMKGKRKSKVRSEKDLLSMWLGQYW